MEIFPQLRADVFAKQKNLAKIYASSGSQTLVEYARGWAIAKTSAETKFFFGYFSKLLSKTYPEEEFGSLLGENGQAPLVSTVDHHGILNHQFFVNSNLIFSQRSGLKYLLCLPTAGVSLNNSSWPGCLMLTAPDGSLRRLSLFRDKIKTQTVLAVKKFSLKDVRDLENRVSALEFLSPDKKNLLLGLIGEIFTDAKLFEQDDFCGQASRLSTALWEKIFPDSPKLLYLPLEVLILELIIKDIAPRTEHFLHKLLLTERGWDSIERHFLGSLGAFSSAHKGSFLFWGISKESRRIRFSRQGFHLVSKERNVPGTILVEELSKKHLYPTSLVCFLVLLYYGVTCLGGFNQVNWLTEIKQKFLALLAEWNEADLAARIAAVPTENFAEGSLAFGLNSQGQVYKPTGIDMFLKQDTGLYQRYIQLAGKVSVADSIDAQLPEIYQVITPGPERDQTLANISESWALNHIDLDQKIKTALSLTEGA